MRNCANPEPVITAAKLWVVVLLFCLATPLVVFAESSIQGNVINAPTKIENSANIAAGSDNKAVHSSVALKNAKMSGTVANSVQSKTAVNVAAGKRNVASQSAIISNNSNISGTLSNSSVGNSKVNMAIGTDNKADQGSVRIENSRIRGTVTNTSIMQKSTNMAVGNSNSASQAAIVMGGAQLRGTVVNTATGGNSVNAAVGVRNEANQSSIVVDGDQAGSGSAVTMPQNTFHADPVGTGQGERSTLAYTGREKVLVQDAKEQKAAQHVPGQVGQPSVP